MSEEQNKFIWFCFSEPQPNLSKDSARWVKNRASREKNEVYFNFSEAQPVLSKSKTNLFDFALPLKTLKSLKPLNFYCPSAPLKTSRNAGRRSCSIHSTITFVTTTKDFFQNSHYHRLRNPTIMVTLLWSLFGYKCIDYSNKLTKKMICLKTYFAVLHHFQVHTK